MQKKSKVTSNIFDQCEVRLIRRMAQSVDTTYVKRVLAHIRGSILNQVCNVVSQRHGISPRRVHTIFASVFIERI